MALLLTDFVYVQTGTTPKKTTVQDVLGLGNNLYGTQYNAATVAARDALTGLSVSPADIVHVSDDGDGKWAKYQPTAVDGNGSGTAWIKIADEDALAAGLGATDLGYTASPTQGTVTNTTGADAILPVVNGTNAGLMIPADKTKLDFVTATQAVDLDAIETASHVAGVLASGDNPLTLVGATQTFGFDISALPDA